MQGPCQASVKEAQQLGRGPNQLQSLQGRQKLNCRARSMAEY